MSNVTPTDLSSNLLPYEQDGPPSGSLEAAVESLLEEIDEENESDARAESDPENEDDLDPEDEDDLDSEEEDDEEDEEGAPETYRVKVDGEEIEVTLEELTKGYSRNADYTRKTQALAEQRRQADFLTERAQNVALAFEQRLEALAMAGQLTPQMEQEYVRAREFQTQQQHAHLAETIQTEKQLLVEAIPEWRDEGVAKREKAAMIEFATKKLGYTPEDLGQVYDHRLMLVLRDAMKYRELSTRGKDALRSKKSRTPVLQPGTREGAPTKSKVSAKARAAALQRLRGSGSPRDAAAAIELLMDD
jgi:hypothetical protein